MDLIITLVFFLKGQSSLPFNGGSIGSGHQSSVKKKGIAAVWRALDSLRLGNLHDQKQEREINLEAAVPVA